MIKLPLSCAAVILIASIAYLVTTEKFKIYFWNFERLFHNEESDEVLADTLFVFKMHDKNHDGFISLHEFQDVALKLKDLSVSTGLVLITLLLQLLTGTQWQLNTTGQVIESANKTCVLKNYFCKTMFKQLSCSEPSHNHWQHMYSQALLQILRAWGKIR